MILVMTEYYNNQNKAGFMRIFLKADYSQAKGNENEIVFTGYNLVFTSAYYPSNDMAYAMAFDNND